ncbi:unnamed protein product [Ilex paraguariensis]|uniref:Uncharacterized protein n=1 Tax=Ilex paraguariensis TaxID=185542 RepID=A0ABC8TFG3_9AQUA
MGWIDQVDLVRLVERENWWDLEEGSVFFGIVCGGGGGSGGIGVGNTVEVGGGARKKGKMLSTLHFLETLSGFVTIGVAVEVAVLVDVLDFGGLSETMGFLDNSKEWTIEMVGD